MATHRVQAVRGPGEAHSHVPAPVAKPAPAVDARRPDEDPQQVREYVADIQELLFRDERLDDSPWPNYMDSQTDINGKMRAILIDWLVEVHMKYRLRTETLFLTVNLIDRYLSCAQITRKKLQLVGVAAMFIAAKFEEISPPALQDFVYITDNAYTKEELLLMECAMLTTLKFKIVVPTAAHFFEQLHRANNCDFVHRELAEYILELGLLDIRMLFYSPSHMVSAALLLSNEILGERPFWPDAIASQSRHTEEQLRGCVLELRRILEGARNNQLQAVRKKFLLPQHHAVAEMAS
jgi:cyclin B